MPSGATPGASQPATDGSLTFSASQAPSGASLVEHAGRVDGPWKRCGPSGKDFRARVITSWSDPGRRGRMGKRDVITLEVLNSAYEWVTRDEV